MSSKVNYQSSQAKTSDEHITKPACKEQLTSGMARCSSNYWNRCTQIMLGPKEEQDAQGMLQVKPMIARYRLNLCNAYQGNSGPSKKPTNQKKKTKPKHPTPQNPHYALCNQLPPEAANSILCFSPTASE